MWSSTRRVRSGSLIAGSEQLAGVASHVCFDVRAKAALEGDVDLAAEGVAECVLELHEVDEAEGGVGGEVEQEVDVALGLGRAAGA